MPNASHSHADCNWMQNLLFVIKIGFFLKHVKLFEIYDPNSAVLHFFIFEITNIWFHRIVLQIISTLQQNYQDWHFVHKNWGKKHVHCAHNRTNVLFLYIHSVQVFMLLSDCVCTAQKRTKTRTKPAKIFRECTWKESESDRKSDIYKENCMYSEKMCSSNQKMLYAQQYGSFQYISYHAFNWHLITLCNSNTFINYPDGSKSHAMVYTICFCVCMFECILHMEKVSSAFVISHLFNTLRRFINDTVV